MRVKVKICGIKTIEAAQAAFGAGADFLGFNFVPTSKRYIKPELAKKINIESGLAMTDRPKIVGIFQNEKIDVVNKLIEYLKLDFVQLHGNESPDYIDKIKDRGVIKTFSLPLDFDVAKTIEEMKNYKADYFLLDRKVQGEGEILNIDKVRELTSIFPIIFGGGLTVENVRKLVRVSKPQVVDVAGGVETDGVKDLEKIKKFIEIAKKYD